jgi:hypothetical protein
VSARFVQVPAAAIRSRLAAAGFRPVDSKLGTEEVYERAHDRDPRYAVRVYSSLTRGADGARDCGQDAIRIVALFTDSQFHWPARVTPVFKATRVHRTGTVDGVLDRMIERAREAYAAINERRLGQASAGAKS